MDLDPRRVDFSQKKDRKNKERKVPLNVSVDPNVKYELELISERTGKSLGLLVRESLFRYIRDLKNGV